MRRWKSTARRVHRMIALAIGLHFVLIATTGAAFIFEPELKYWARANRGWVATPGDVGPDRCYRAVSEAFPEWSANFLSFPTPEAPFYTAYLGGESDNFWTDVFVDPGTGRIVGTINNASFSVEGFLQIAIQLHIRLCAGEFGRQLVDASVVLFVVELVTGVALWWPRFRRVLRAFTIRLRRSRFLAYYDVHRLAGVTAAPLLIVMSLTGLLWGYPQLMVPLVYWCCGERAPVQSDAYREPEQAEAVELLRAEDQTIPLLQIVRNVTAELRPTAIEYLYMEQRQSPTITVGIRPAGTAVDEDLTETVVVDRRTGRISRDEQRSRPQRSFADRLTAEWAHELHYGTIGGLTTRILYFAACLAVDVLYLTGLAMWFIKRRKRRMAAAGR